MKKMIISMEKALEPKLKPGCYLLADESTHRQFDTFGLTVVP